ncbi:GATA zinc finger domain containing 2Ab isoform X1 [Megalops cyprinoides]|uniref:GATA zinc finger domain containing 2Ab isoform X1 n=1 Tax=Megalops cyprinoides TaxID=118141 RepID=UPI001864F462|nr:GATA zinc finger domain containing 2Ab isoform X1 [Megalops cyprinoides]
MSEEAVRQTRSQKRALERDSLPGDVDSKKVKLERGELAKGEPGGAADGVKVKTEPVAKVSSILKAGEVKATIKVELQTDEPVDMSTSKSDLKKERHVPSPDDVIVLSDNEPSSPRMNGLSHCSKETDTEMLMKSSPDERERIIKQLKEELRLEEAKLVLLKKLRQSQIQKETSVQKPAGSSSSVATPPPLVRGSISTSKGPLQVSSGRSSGTVIPPPLVRGGQQVPSKLGSQNAQIVMPPLVRGAQPISVSPQQIHSLRQQQQQHSGSGPPPLLLAPRATVPNVQVQGQRIIQQGLIRVANVPNTSVLVNIPQASPTNLKGSSVTSQAGLASSVSTVNANDSPASRQAAAKLALRKQLEKTLLEIPPPKPPAPELNFLPSAANNEFIYLVGLEEVVQNLLDTLGKGKQQVTAVAGVAPVPKDPYTCAQCKTDFTSRWRQEKSGTIMCEQCMTSNQKKSLKAEHTNRLKAAFVKALQQEQEIEQRILQQQTASPVSKTPSSLSSSSSVVKVEQQVLVSQQLKQARASSLQQQQQQQHSRGAAIGRHHSTIKQSPGQLSRSVQSVGVRGVPHTFSPSSQLQNAVTAAALVSRPGKHAMRAGGKVNSSSNPAAGAWRKQNTVTTGVTMAYVNPSLSVHKTSSAVDRQREYLLDMIPSRSISQTANTWK